MFCCSYGSISIKMLGNLSPRVVSSLASLCANSASPLMLCIAVWKARTEKPDVGCEKRPRKIPRQRNLLTEKFSNQYNSNKCPGQTLGSNVGWS